MKINKLKGYCEILAKQINVENIVFELPAKTELGNLNLVYKTEDRQFYIETGNKSIKAPKEFVEGFQLFKNENRSKK